ARGTQPAHRVQAFSAVSRADDAGARRLEIDPQQIEGPPVVLDDHNGGPGARSRPGDDTGQAGLRGRRPRRPIGAGRQRDPEGAALSRFTFNPDPAPMQLKNPLGQGETEPRALGLTGGPGALLERVEDALAVLGRHAYPRVGDQHDKVLTTYGG